MSDSWRLGCVRSCRLARGIRFASCLGLLLAGQIVWGVSRVTAEEWLSSVVTVDSPASFMDFAVTDYPSDAKAVVQVLNEWLKAWQGRKELQLRINQLLTEQEELKTTLVTVDGEREIRQRNQQQIQQHLDALAQERNAYLETIRDAFEARLQQEMVLMQERLSQEMAVDFDRQIREFDERQRTLMMAGIQQELDLKANELQRLALEVEQKTEEILARLKNIEAGEPQILAVKQTLQQAMADRQSAFEAYRQQLQGEYETLLATRQEAFSQQLKQQQATEQKRRLILKEASLRQAMADLMNDMGLQHTQQNVALQQSLNDARQQLSQLDGQYAALQARVQTLSEALEASRHRIEQWDVSWSDWPIRFEEAFQRVPKGLDNSEVLQWFHTVLTQLPERLALELETIHQRVVVKAQQNLLLQEQHQFQRQRTLAMQLSHEMEQQYQQIQQEAQQIQQARRQKVEALLAKANGLSAKGQFNEALQCVVQAQALDAPEPSRIVLVRDDILTAQRQTLEQTTTQEIQQLFTKAIQAFQQEQYEQAIHLFEEVVAQEAVLNAAMEKSDSDSISMAERL